MPVQGCSPLHVPLHSPISPQSGMTGAVAGQGGLAAAAPVGALSLLLTPGR